MKDDQKLETLLRKVLAAKFAYDMLKDIVRRLPDPLSAVADAHEEWK